MPHSQLTFVADFVWLPICQKGKEECALARESCCPLKKCVWMEELFFMDGLWLLAAKVAGSSCHNYYTIKKTPEGFK